MDISGLEQNTLQITFKIGWGLDSSGEHTNYHQLSKVSYTTKQVMSVYFAVMEVNMTDTCGNVVTWSSKSSGANKPQNT